MKLKMKLCGLKMKFSGEFEVKVLDGVVVGNYRGAWMNCDHTKC